MRIITTLAILAISVCTCFAQNSKYENAMLKGIEKLSAGFELENYQQALNIFERVAQAEKDKWMPSYYAAYSHIMMATYKMGKGDMNFQSHVDKAQVYLDAVKGLDKDNSELVTMQGYVYQAMIWSNPEANGMIYAPKAQVTLEKAITLNPENPRPYYLIGQNLFYTPAQWGGGAAPAKKYLTKAKEKYATARPESALHPTWGAAYNDYLIGECDKKLGTTKEVPAEKLNKAPSK